ncbi:hypothetical protein FA15DRAFT_670540 [Coprinopsis marcescibilis]|uniref:Uncharacterized protein n=1 Tax=Coprinopsis marcescibilis TaxID=230819 RepID=A0A5C3KSB0_COPMA|nr:hypothetical protein FA15DRAFT_670540 [Coprinopsis marcescibilis]
MPTSPLYPVSREDCGVTEPQTSFNHLFQQPDFMAFEPDQPHSPALDPLLEAPSTSTPMEDVEDEDDDDEVHQYCYIPSTSSPTSPQLCGFGQSGCGGDAEMDNHPISPVTSYSLSPVSISSSMKRARSRGKTMRILGYEAHEAYSCGIQFSTAVPMGQGKKRAYFN